MSEILQGDCLEVMKSFPDNHFSGIVCDPPYGLHFMGKDWDYYGKIKNQNRYDKPHVKCNVNAYEAAKYDERRNDEFQSFITQFGIEAMRIVKPGGHILMCGAPRRYHRQACGLEDAGWEIRDCLCWLFGSGFPKSHNHFGPEGYGTALKPAHEPILLAIKPLEGTFAQNYEKWGVGGINIDACRIGTEKRFNAPATAKKDTFNRSPKSGVDYLGKTIEGRWPANLLLDEEAAAMVGVASRFFYCPKTSSRERNEGLDELPDVECQSGCGGAMPIDDNGKERDRFKTITKNHHPTVKPLALMRYLITLISPPTNALILDPFAGSGSTIVAAEQLGIQAIGIEKQPEYVEIARARVLHAAKKASEVVEQMKLF